MSVGVCDAVLGISVLLFSLAVACGTVCVSWLLDRRSRDEDSDE